MPTIREGRLTFHFPTDWRALKWDDGNFHVQQHFQNVCGGAKAIDILAIEPGDCLWHIEAKDYRVYPRTKSITLADEVAQKVRDTLAALVVARISAIHPGEMVMAATALRCDRIRVVLHLEQPASRSKLFPWWVNPANVKQALKQLIKPIDPDPLVTGSGRMFGVTWTVQVDP